MSPWGDAEMGCDSWCRIALLRGVPGVLGDRVKSRFPGARDRIAGVLVTLDLWRSGAASHRSRPCPDRNQLTGCRVLHRLLSVQAGRPLGSETASSESSAGSSPCHRARTEFAASIVPRGTLGSHRANLALRDLNTSTGSAEYRPLRFRGLQRGNHELKGL